MTTVTNRLLIWLEAQTSQAEARLTAAGAAVERMGRQQVVATRAVGQLQSGLRSLATSALGATGPVGNLATGLASLAGGITGLAALGATAGIVLLLRSLGAEAKEAAKRIEDLHQQWLGLMRAAGPNVATAGALTGTGATKGLIERQTELKAQLERARLGTVIRGRAGSEMRIVDRDLVQRLETELAQLNVNIALLRSQLQMQRNQIIDRSAITGGARPSPPSEALVTEVQRFRLRGPQPGRGAMPRAPMEDLAAMSDVFSRISDRLIQVAQQEQARLDVLAVLGNAEMQAAISAANMGGAFQRLVDEMERAEAALVSNAQALEEWRTAQAISLVFGVSASIQRGRSAGGILSAGAAFVGMVNPVAGAIVEGIGNFIQSSAERRSREHRELLTALLQDEDRPIRIYIDEFTEGHDRRVQRQARNLRDFSDRGGTPGFGRPETGPERGP